MEPPPQPPGVAAQMGGGGAPPFADVGGMMAQKQSAGNPLKSALDMTTKMWANAIKGNPKLGPYVERAMKILEAGIEQASQPAAGAPPAENGGAVPQGPQPGAMPG